MGTRTKLVFAALLAACMVATIGCNRGRSRGGGGGGGGGGTDSGTTTPMEDGGTTERDSGGIVLMDSGPTTECDSTRPCPTGETCEGGVCVTAVECTSNSDCLSSEECVDGMCEMVTPSCPSNIVSRVTTQYCSDETRACTEACTDGACISTCLQDDPDTNCWACAQQNIIECFNRNGCQEEWNCLNECFEDNCASSTSDTCVSTYCSSEDDAYTACSETVPSSAACGRSWTPCVGL